MPNQLYNFDLLIANSGGDIEFIEKMIQLFIEKTPFQVHRINQGLLTKNHDEIKAASHKLLSSVEILKAESLISLLREIEKLAIEKEDFKKISTKTKQLEKNINVLIKELEQLDFQSL
jgi:HPt (histidine-containing phosphotransfer) domain-containing protein